MKLPAYIKKALNSASGTSRCYVNDSRAQSWLSKNLSLFTDSNEHKIESYVVDFCWITQKWFVKA